MIHDKSLQSCLTLCDPIDGSPPGSSVPGILQARILEWVAISFSHACMHAKSLQSCLTLCNPMDKQPTRLLCPWDFPGKSTGVGCHCLLRLSMLLSQFVPPSPSPLHVHMFILYICVSIPDLQAGSSASFL